jgi:hypothetical protein
MVYKTLKRNTHCTVHSKPKWLYVQDLKSSKITDKFYTRLNTVIRNQLLLGQFFMKETNVVQEANR